MIVRGSAIADNNQAQSRALFKQQFDRFVYIPRHWLAVDDFQHDRGVGAAFLIGLRNQFTEFDTQVLHVHASQPRFRWAGYPEDFGHEFRAEEFLGHEASFHPR